MALAIAIALFGAINIAPRRLRGSPILSSYVLVLALFGFYFWLPPVMLLWLREGDYIWASGYGGYNRIALTEISVLMSIFIFTVTYHAIQQAQRQQFSISAPHTLGKSAKITCWIFIFVGIALKISVIILSGGLQSTVTRFSQGIEDSLRLDALPSYITLFTNFSSVADLGIVWLYLVAMHNKRSVGLLSIVTFIIIGLSFATTGKRLFLLAPVFAIVLGVHFYRRPLTTAIAPFAVAGVLALGFGTLMYRIYAPASINDVNIDLYQVPWAEGSILKFYFLSLEFSTFETLSLNLFDRDVLNRMFGGTLEAFFVTNIEPIAYLVPRIFWESKPTVFYDLSHANRAVMLGGSLSEGGGIAGTILGTSWTIAGPIGQFIAVSGLAALCAFVDGARSIRGIPSPKALIIYSFMLMFVFHLFRQGTLGWTVIIVVGQHIGLISGFMVIATLARRDHHRLTKHWNRDLKRSTGEGHSNDL